jgi:Ferritin-like domain
MTQSVPTYRKTTDKEANAMASNDVEILDPAAPVEKSTTSGFELDRRHFIAALGVAGAAAGTALISAHKALAQQPLPNGYNQVDVINLMLQVKYLKATLYSYITQGTDLPGASQVTVGTGAVYNAPAKITTFTAQIADLFNEMYYDELNQLIALRAIQGVTVAPRQTINLIGTGPSGGITSTNPPATTTLTPAQAIALARMLEDLSTSAFTTAAIYLTGPRLALAMQALASDGAHAGAIRLLAIQNNVQFQGTQFASVTTSNTAQSAVTFSGQLITGNSVIFATLPTNVPLVGSMATGIGIPPGAGAVITAVAAAPNAALTAITGKTSPTLTLVSSVTGLQVNQPITGTFIPAGTYITAVGTNTLTLSANATTASVVAPTGFVTNLSPTITGVSSTTGLIIGQPITGTGIPTTPTATTIMGFTTAAPLTITMSANATVTSLLSLTGAVVSGSDTIKNLSTINGLVIGQPITGAGIPTSPATTIIGVGSSSLQMSVPATASSVASVSFTGIVTSGSKNVTLVSSVAGLVSGQQIGGAGIPAGTTMTTITGSTGTIVMSANATATSSVPITANVTLNSNIVSGLGSVAGITLNQTITGTGIPASTTVTQIGTNTITISNNATLTNVGGPYNATSPETIFAGGQLLTTPTTETVTSPTTEAITIGLTQITLAGAATVTGLNTISIVVADTQDVEPGDPGTAALSATGPTAITGTSPAVYQGFFNTAGAATSGGTNTPPGFAFARSFQQILAVLYGFNSTNSVIVTQNFEGGFYPVGVSGNITSAI